MDKKVMEEAEAAERLHAEEALQPPRPTEADLGEVMELNAVDQYVAAAGEFPLSGDIAGPDVVEDGLLADANLADERVETRSDE